MNNVEITALSLIAVRTIIEGMVLWVLWKRAGTIVVIAKVLAKVSWTPVIIDGTLWATIALFGFQQAYLSSDEAYKYVSPTVLYWMKYGIGSLAAVAGSLKAFRSTVYAEHLTAAKPPNPTLPPTAPLPTIPTVTDNPKQP